MRPGVVYQPESPMGEVVPHHLVLRISLNVTSGIESFRGSYFPADMHRLETFKDHNWLIRDGNMRIAYQGELASRRL